MKSPNPKRAKSVALGFLAEEKAADFLRQNGFDVLNTRFKTKHGEIDLVISQEDLIAFVEVKARSSLEEALHAVTRRARGRIANAAQGWICVHDVNPTQERLYRFDVVAVLPDGSIHHLEDAFRLED